MAIVLPGMRSRLLGRPMHVRITRPVTCGAGHGVVQVAVNDAPLPVSDRSGSEIE